MVPWPGTEDGVDERAERDDAGALPDPAQAAREASTCEYG